MSKANTKSPYAERNWESEQALLSHDDSHWELGQPYFIRTVTHHFTGRLIKVTKSEIVLVEAAWVADDGRFNVTMSAGKVSEAEPYPQERKVIIGRSSLIDAAVWPFKLISEVVAG